MSIRFSALSRFMSCEGAEPGRSCKGRIQSVGSAFFSDYGQLLQALGMNLRSYPLLLHTLLRYPAFGPANSIAVELSGTHV
jgi:hypothetical protein